MDLTPQPRPRRVLARRPPSSAQVPTSIFSPVVSPIPRPLPSPKQSPTRQLPAPPALGLITVPESPPLLPREPPAIPREQWTAVDGYLHQSGIKFSTNTPSTSTPSDKMPTIHEDAEDEGAEPDPWMWAVLHARVRSSQDEVHPTPVVRPVPAEVLRQHLSESFLRLGRNQY